MASSEKAGALKDAYVSAIADELGGEAMAQAGAMENAKLAGKLGLPVGNQASVLVDLTEGTASQWNDGDPSITIDSNFMSGPGMSKRKKIRNETAAYPIDGKPFNSYEQLKLNEFQLRHFADQLYN